MSTTDPKTNKLTDEAIAEIKSLDLSLYNPDIEHNRELDDELMENMRKVIGISAGAPLTAVFVFSVIFGSCGGVIISLCIALMTCLVLFDGFLGQRFFGLFAGFREPISAIHEQAVSDRIQLLEGRIGGIYNASAYVDIKNVGNHVATRWLAVLKQSSEKVVIVDLKAYCEVLATVRQKLQEEQWMQERSDIEKSIVDMSK